MTMIMTTTTTTRTNPPATPPAMAATGVASPSMSLLESAPLCCSFPLSILSLDVAVVRTVCVLPTGVVVVVVVCTLSAGVVVVVRTLSPGVVVVVRTLSPGVIIVIVAVDDLAGISKEASMVSVFTYHDTTTHGCSGNSSCSASAEEVVVEVYTSKEFRAYLMITI